MIPHKRNVKLPSTHCNVPARGAENAGVLRPNNTGTFIDWLLIASAMIKEFIKVKIVVYHVVKKLWEKFDSYSGVLENFANSFIHLAPIDVKFSWTVI